MLTFATWFVIAILVWRVETLAYKVEKLQRMGQNPPRKAQPDAAQPPVQQPAAIFEPLPEKQAAAPAAAQSAEKLTPQTPKAPLTLDKLFSWIGGFVLLLGIVFCIKYSIEKNLISPSVRVVLGVLTGAALWGAGAYIRKENLKTTAHTLLACGLCVCYLTLFAAYHFYHILPAEDAFVLLALIAVASFATAVWKKVFYVGILAQIIGFLTPFLLVTGAAPVYWFLLGYGALITVSAVIAAAKCNWENQIYVAIVLSALYVLALSPATNALLFMRFALLFGAVFAVAAAVRRQGKFLLCAFISQIPLLLVLLFDLFSGGTMTNPLLLLLALWWALFALIPLAAKTPFMTDKAAWITSAAVGLFAGTLIQTIVWLKAFDWDGGWIPFLFALAYAGIFCAVYAWEPIAQGIQKLRLSLLGAVGVFFCALFIIIAADAHQWVVLGLAGAGAGLVYLWHKIKLSVWQTAGLVLLSLGALWLPWVETPKPITFLLNRYLYTYLICAGACFAGAYFWRETAHHTAKTYLQVLGGLVLFALLNVEIASYFSQGKTALSLNFCGMVTEAAAYTIAWALCGAGCLLLAVKKIKGLSKAGILLVTLALLKLFLSDLWQLPLAARIVVSIAVAFILLGISFYYQQMRKQL